MLKKTTPNMGQVYLETNIVQLFEKPNAICKDCSKYAIACKNIPAFVSNLKGQISLLLWTI